MELELTVALPRQPRSVVVARHLVRAAMVEMGVSDGCVHEIEVAVSEACTNVLEHAGQHAGPSVEYEVRLQVLGDRCVLRVVDIGQLRRRLRLALASDPADEDVVDGEGVQLMRALADRVGLATLPERGTVVSLEKRLVYAEP